MSGGNFVVTDEAGKIWQPCGISGSPCPWALLVVLQIPNRSRSGIPGRRTGRRAVELV